MHKIFSLVIPLIAIPALLVFAQKPADVIHHLLIGTYTNGKSEGIYVYAFNLGTGEAKHEFTYKGISNPSFLAVSPNKKFVYSVTEDRGKKARSVLLP